MCYKNNGKYYFLIKNLAKIEGSKASRSCPKEDVSFPVLSIWNSNCNYNIVLWDCSNSDLDSFQQSFLCGDGALLVTHKFLWQIWLAGLILHGHCAGRCCNYLKRLFKKVKKSLACLCWVSNYFQDDGAGVFRGMKLYREVAGMWGGSGSWHAHSIAVGYIWI